MKFGILSYARFRPIAGYYTTGYVLLFSKKTDKIRFRDKYVVLPFRYYRDSLASVLDNREVQNALRSLVHHKKC